jgi:predicted sulfurtransferase
VNELCPFDFSFQPAIEPHSLKIANIVQGKESHDSTTSIKFLSPSEFHQAILKSTTDSDAIILDTRNYYESQIGYFVNAITPPIRKFSDLPAYVNKNPELKSKKVFAYCTGGIRCEKASRFIQQSTGGQVSVLEGGIHNYLEWAKQENVDPLYFGANYVFDGRRVMGKGDAKIMTAKCLYCSMPCADYTKCVSKNCHLIIPACDECRTKWHHCCKPCEQGNNCNCELQRKEMVSMQSRISLAT